jgi:hypothetical protein
MHRKAAHNCNQRIIYLYIVNSIFNKRNPIPSTRTPQTRQIFRFPWGVYTVAYILLPHLSFYPDININHNIDIKCCLKVSFI